MADNPSLDELIKLQQDRMDALRQSLINFNKDSVTRKTAAYHRKRISKIEEIYQEFYINHKLIVCSDLDIQHQYYKSKQCSLFEELYLEVYCTFVESLEQLFPSNSAVAATTSGITASPIQRNIGSSTQFPNIPVPSFSGKHIDWPSFFDSFNRLIHQNMDLSGMQRFHFLKQAIPKDRDVDIHQMSLTEANYLTAWDLLMKRYNNPRLLFMHHMNTLYKIPNLYKEGAEEMKSIINVANVCVNAFKRLNIPIENCDHWIAHYLSTKLPKETHQAWEYHLGSKTQIPTLSDFEDFLNNRLITIDAIENRNTSHQTAGFKPTTTDSHKQQNKNFKRSHHISTKSEKNINHVVNNIVTKIENCPICNELHIIRRCPKFLSKDCFERKTIIEKLKRCFNCLSKSHGISQCISSKNCYQCGQRHHTLLHFPNISEQSNNSFPLTNQPTTSSNSNLTTFNPQSTVNSILNNNNILCSTNTTFLTPKVLLATALLHISNPINNKSFVMRALIDQGSEITIISEQAVQLLGLKRKPILVEIGGVGGTTSNSCKCNVNFNITSIYNNSFQIYVDNAYVLPSLTANLPTQSIQPQNWPHIQDLTLADPTFYQSSKVDLILGVDIFSQIILPDLRVGTIDQPIAQHTQLGWILSGKTTTSTSHSKIVRCQHTSIELESVIRKFLDAEEIPSSSTVSSEDEWCETFFNQTHIRQSNGKYRVRLPLKSLFDPSQTIGKSKQLSLNRFYQLERKLTQNPEYYQQYQSEINEYFQLNQIKPATTSEYQHLISPPSKLPIVTSCVLAHHAVLKEDSLTTKMRIVFDASSKTTNGKSLNDILCIGPSLQNELSAVILNWRFHRFVFTADIKKMYRCIDMHTDDTQYQRILWRNSSGHIQEYCLTTVTFGTASAPFTAIRVIHQLADDEKHRYPLAENVLKNDMYVDDILTGGDCIKTTLNIQNQVINALQSAGFELRKWSSNSQQLLQSIPVEYHSTSTTFNIGQDETVKALGTYWQPNLDLFKFKITFNINASSTKRNVLSTIARLFDPLGFISPVVVKAKIILKNIWNAKIIKSDQSTSSLDWDDILPDAINLKWQEFLLALPDIQGICVPRWIDYISDDVQSVELHCFCDGSASAYAASVYIRIQNHNKKVFTHLLTSKSKVTPTKPLTIPRIELNGAVLAVKLITWVKKTLNPKFKDIPTFYWCDATIILYWIYGDVNRWNTFVANRVNAILNVSKPTQWSYVNTTDNPSDCATRGLTPNQLSTFHLWWYGPHWLLKSKSEWPQFELNNLQISNESSETKKTTLIANVIINENCIIKRYSSLNKLIRIVSILLRFYFNIQSKNKTNRQFGSTSVAELQKGLLCLIRIVQHEAFHEEIRLINANQPVFNKSKLISLTPFIDNDRILRVRGRLQHSSLSYDQKHPIILPASHHFTYLIIDNAHQNTLHGGIQLTLSNIRRKFWVINSKRTVKNQLQKCIKCFKTKPTISTQLMGDLPMHRINPPQRAFLATGVDYTGAIELKSSKYRGNTIYKAYIAVFICLATKAVHLEAVTGMSTEHFLWALQRFIGRRGACHDIYSDCGTNFTGADKILNQYHKTFIKSIENHITPKLAAQGIRWHFNPPHSPNFGGLWEANVKSVKYHLKRITHGTRLTYEEFSTVLIRIEASLNSRPLCSLTTDINDLFVLTPGHFLIGDSLLSMPEPPTSGVTINQQYLNIQRMVQQFWSNWSSDWLSHLQTRPKWQKEMPNLRVNDLIIIKEDRLPPNQWILGRIIELHPGSDKLVRVATIRTQNGIYKRSVSKICRLPLPNYTDDSNQEQQYNAAINL